jgi:hypothetical protein
MNDLIERLEIKAVHLESANSELRVKGNNGIVNILRVVRVLE